MTSDTVITPGDRRRSRSTGAMLPSHIKSHSTATCGSLAGTASLHLNGHVSSNGHLPGDMSPRLTSAHLTDRPPRVRRTSSNSSDRELRVVVMGAPGVGKTGKNIIIKVNKKCLTLSILNLPSSSSSTTSRELLSQFSTCSG